MSGSFLQSFPQASYLPVRTIRLGLLARIFSGGTPDKSRSEFWERGSLPWIGSGEVNQFVVERPTAYITPEAVSASSTRLMPSDSVIIALAGQGKTKAMAAQMGIDAYGNQSLACIAEFKGHNRYLLWWLISLYREIRGLSSQDTRDGLNQAMLGQIPVPGFDLPTQNRIADFLDRETARIDQLMEKKQRLMDVLMEKVHSEELNLVLARHINSRRSIEIPWADSVPDHWSVQAVWMLFRLGRGRVISHEAIAQYSGDFPVYSSQTENNGVMGHIDTYDFDGDYITWTTDGAKAGTVFRRSGKFNCTNVCGTLKPMSAKVSLEYFQCVLSQATAFFVRHDINPKLMNSVMAGIRLPVPPYAEQIEIAEKIYLLRKPRVKIMEITGASIHLIREFRSALITAAVTGQIDVDNWCKRGDTDRQLEAIEEAIRA